MPEKDSFIHFLYTTRIGRTLLMLIQKFRLDRWIVRFLRSGRSRPFLKWYVRHNRIPVTKEELREYRSFRDFFARERDMGGIDITPEHLISPCDGWMSAFRIDSDCRFQIKGSHYRVEDLLDDIVIAENYQGGIALVFRLCASDYHHYAFIDDGYTGHNHYIEGQLHSVQPAACETCPVFTLNRRCWCLMATENFGPVVQTEIGALIVGGIVNRHESTRCFRGFEKGHFELAGSTIVLLFEPNRIVLLPSVVEALKTGHEVRVDQGMWIANRCDRATEQ